MTAEAKRRALVTGGGRGLGAAIVRALAAAGHDVTFTYRASSAEAETLLKTLQAERPSQAFAALALDLADKAAVDAFVKDVERQAFSALVHNAGQSYDSLAMMMDQAKAEAAMQVNFWSFTRIGGALARQMMRAREGRLVVIGSITALQANQGNAAYAASKAALLGYVRTLAIEIARTGVTVNYVAPGFIDTEMTHELDAKQREQIIRRSALRRLPEPADVAAAVEFLLSDQARNITGTTVTVDAGSTA